MSEQDTSWPERRFSQAISEGDGISVIPLLRGDIGSLARAAEEAGAEAIAVESVGEIAALRTATDLPLLLRRAAADVVSLEAVREAGADACILVYEELEGEEELLEQLVGAAADLGLDCALDVRDEDELEEALERLDPDILVISERDRDRDEVELERTLDLLPDVPVGKLVVSESPVTTREQVLELERAGVDAVLIAVELHGGGGFAAVLAELTGHRPGGA
jgi:indole-3-glycerol phosphate synthase